MKHMKGQLETGVNKMKKPFSLEEAVLCSEILPDITTVLNMIVISPFVLPVVLWLNEESHL